MFQDLRNVLICAHFTLFLHFYWALTGFLESFAIYICRIDSHLSNATYHMNFQNCPRWSYFTDYAKDYAKDRWPRKSWQQYNILQNFTLIKWNLYPYLQRRPSTTYILHIIVAVDVSWILVAQLYQGILHRKLYVSPEI